MLDIGAEGAQQWCKEAFVVWHEADSQGNPGTHPVAFEYRLGTLSLLPGVEPDPDHPGQVKPVWGVAEVLEATTEAVTPEATVLDQTVFAVRPQPGKPQSLVDWDGPPEDDRWEWWNSFHTYYDPARQARAVWVTNYNAYTLVDRFGNTVWGCRDTRTTTYGQSRLTVNLPYQETTGPDFRAYALEMKWWADGSDQMPEGVHHVDLFVSYPASPPDWPAGEIVTSTVVDLQGGNQTHLKSYGGYEARFGMDDGEFPMSVSPEAKEAAIPRVGPGPAWATPRNLDSPRRLALVLLTGREAPSLQEVFRAPHHPWEWTGGTWVERPVQPAPDPRIDVASKPKLRMKLVDVHGNVQTAAAFKVHLCPRFDHEGSPQAPDWPCPTAPRESTNGVIEELAMNPGVVGNGDPPAPDATGYLGLELTQAPTAPGTYYVYVESLDKDVKVRDQTLLHLDDNPEGQYQGGFALCTVTGAEILDQNFQRIDPLTVDQITAAYIRMSDSAEPADTFTLDFATEDEDGTAFDQASDVSLTRLGSSSTFLSEPIALYPEWESGGGSGLRAQATGDKKVVVKKKAGNAKAKRKTTSKVLASRVTKSGADYVFPMGTRGPFSVGKSFTFNDNAQHLFLCSPDAGDCGNAQTLPPSQVTWMLGPLGVDQEGDNQIARMEIEPSETPPQAYVRGIRISTTRTTDGYVTLSAASGVQSVKQVKLQVRRPWHLGSRTDGYPVTYPDTDVQLEPIVIDMADRYGIPPQFLMSQVTKEANVTGNPARYNAYSYRYEAYGFDFLYITGDRSFCCDANGHKFLVTYHPFLSSGLPGVTGQAEMRPVAAFDVVPVRYEVLPQPIGNQPTAAYQIPAGPNGPPAAWDVVVTDTAGVSQYQRVDPGFAVLGGLLGPNDYAVDCRTGRITFGAPPADPAHLKVNYQPARNVYAQRSGLGAALGTAISTGQIASSCPGCDVLPPSDPAMTISAWAQTRASAGHALTQTINRYGRPFSSPQNWYLLQEDPSFDLQGQWYGGASFGLLQVWPANANTTINRMSPSDRARIRAIYDPLSEPGTKLFDPQVGVEFGAAGDRYAPLTEPQEGNRIAHEPECVLGATSAPFNNCTWSRYWARRFTAFNAGTDRDDEGVDAFARYGWPIVENSSNFSPMLQPVQ